MEKEEVDGDREKPVWAVDDELARKGDRSEKLAELLVPEADMEEE